MTHCRYFIDSEFIEDGKIIDLISIGIVSDDGREYYAINQDCDFFKANDWIKENVLEDLFEAPLSEDWRSKNTIASEILDFVGWRQNEPHFNEGKKPEFWGYYFVNCLVQ